MFFWGIFEFVLGASSSSATSSRLWSARISGSVELPHGKLAVHEEFPDAVAEAVSVHSLAG
jgi:hypothetical protein